jgi:hypothetical protein
VILTSPDGIIWAKQDSSVTETLWGIAAGRGEFVAVGSNSTIVLSKNANAWIKQRSCVIDDLRHILFTRNRFLIVGTHTIHTSSLKGRSSLASWPSPVGFSTISVGPQGFIGVERNGQLRTSSFGRKWRNPGIFVPVRVFGLVGGGNHWVAVGLGAGPSLRQPEPACQRIPSHEQPTSVPTLRPTASRSRVRQHLPALRWGRWTEYVGSRRDHAGCGRDR